jgi:hypothetical protein
MPVRDSIPVVAVVGPARLRADDAVLADRPPAGALEAQPGGGAGHVLGLVAEELSPGRVHVYAISRADFTRRTCSMRPEPSARSVTPRRAADRNFQGARSCLAPTFPSLRPGSGRLRGDVSVA